MLLGFNIKQQRANWPKNCNYGEHNGYDMLDNNEIIQTQVNILAFASSLSWIKPNVESFPSMFTQANLFI